MIELLACPFDNTEIDMNMKCKNGHQFKNLNGILDFEINNESIGFLERIAPIYENIWAPIGFYVTTGKSYFSILKKISNFINGNVIVDVGTGTGKLFDYINCKVCIGIDISLRFLEILKKKRGNKVVPVRANAKALPIKNGVVDAVTSTLVLHMLDEPHKAILEISRITKPKGIFISIILANTKSLIGKFLSKLWNINLREKDEYIKIMKEARFDIIQVEPIGPWIMISALKL
jgi:ubiquinone/menaquinone biosynthesis C-methylase UbiE